MALTNNYMSLLRYKVQQVGWRRTLRVCYLDLSEVVLHHASKRFPWLPVSPRSIQIEHDEPPKTLLTLRAGGARPVGAPTGQRGRA